MYLTRIFYPVGQGGFFSEVFRDSNHKVCFTAVYDCGSISGANILSKSIAEFKQSLPDDRKQIDILFISHFHVDHVNGLNELIDGLTVRKTVIPLLSNDCVLFTRINNFFRSPNDNISIDAITLVDEIIKDLYGISKKESRFGEIYAVSSVDEIAEDQLPNVKNILPVDEGIMGAAPFWHYSPYNSSQFPSEGITNFITEIGKLDKLVDGKHLNTKLLIRGYRNKIRELYRKHLHIQNDNLYTLVVTSAPNDDVSGNYNSCTPGCLYLGDFDFSHNTLPILDLKGDYNPIGTVQIPHHGSRDSYSKQLSKEGGKCCIIATGSNNTYHHPDFWVIKELLDANNTVYVVSEGPKSKAEFEFDLNPLLKNSAN